MITIVYDNYYGDWVAVYNDNGDVVFQGHSVSGRDILEALDIPVTTLDASAHAFDDSFPDKLEEITKVTS